MPTKMVTDSRYGEELPLHDAIVRFSDDGIPEVEVSWVHQHGDVCRLIDVRNLDSHTGALGHVAGAELIPVSALEQLVQAWPLDEPIILFCKDGQLAAEAVQMLLDMGYTRVASMHGGMEAWHQQGYPVSYDC